jgi:hypothetical protein
MFLLIILLFISIVIIEFTKTLLTVIEMMKTERKNILNYNINFNLIEKEINNIQLEIIRTKNKIDTEDFYCFKENVDIYYQILFYKTENKSLKELQYMREKMLKFYETLLKLEKISKIHTTICMFR